MTVGDNMETLPARTTDKSVAGLLDKMKGELTKALGESIPVDYFVRVALTTVRKNPILIQCTPMSLIQCLMDCAQVRLFPDSILGEAYLVPFRRGQDYECTLIIGYRGLVKLVRRSGDITNVYGGAVYENDVFELEYGTNRKMVHKPKITGDRGARIGAVGFIGYANGGSDFMFCDADYISRVKAMSRGSSNADSPWNKWTDEMWAKTALRRVCKTAELTPEAQSFVQKAFDAEGAIDVESTVESTQPAKSAILAPGSPQMAPAAATGTEGGSAGQKPPKGKPGPKRGQPSQPPPTTTPGPDQGTQTQAQTETTQAPPGDPGESESKPSGGEPETPDRGTKQAEDVGGSTPPVTGNPKDDFFT